MMLGLRSKIFFSFIFLIALTIFSNWIKLKRVKVGSESRRRDYFRAFSFNGSSETEKILRNRRNRLESYCTHLRRFHQESLSTLTWRQLPLGEKPRLYYSDKYKIIVCGVPKCGSTQWRKALLIAENDVNTTAPSEIEHEKAFHLAWDKRLLWNRFDVNTPQGREEVDKRLNTYYRVMTVREPLERLVSAYIDKMLPGGSGENIYTSLSQNIHRSIGKINNSDRATFPEFVTYVLKNSRSKEDLDIHWRPYHYICDPCRTNYHHIAKLETITRDAAFISSLLGLSQNITFPGPITDVSEEEHHWKPKYMQYLQNISTRQLQALSRVYAIDYKLFGYDFPSLNPG